jgi:hypothetical protein
MSELEEQIAALRAQLEEARAAQDTTMRRHRRCRGCGGRVIYHVERVLDKGDSGAYSLSLNYVYLSRLLGPRPVGELEAFVCAGCGLVEWYAKRPEELIPGPGIRLYTEDKERGPFR